MSTATARPSCKPPNLKAIPGELRERHAWVLWRYEWNEQRGDWAKIPRTTEGGKARTSDPSTWATFDRAIEVYQSGGFDGVGCVFSSDDDLIGVDLDDCIDPTTGEMYERAVKIVDRFATYTEVSPSGRGVKMWARGDLKDWPLTRKGAGTRRRIEWDDNHSGEIEAYQHGQYFTVTGSTHGDRNEIADANGSLPWLRDLMFPDDSRDTPALKTTSATLEDDQLIQRARDAGNGAKFEALFAHGDLSGYGDDHSRADLALCQLLAFWTQDPAQIERIMDRSALGIRGKWRDREDYREGTINRALENQTERYSGNRSISGTIETKPRQATGGEGDTDPWFDPEPLDLDPEAPAFDLEAMVERACPPLADMLYRLSEAVQAPVDIGASIALPIALSGLAHRVTLWAGGEHREVPAMFVVARLDAGERKSTTIRTMLDPVRAWAKDERVRVEPDRKQIERERERLEERRKKLRKKYNDTDPILDDDNPIVTELDAIERDLEAIKVPPYPLGTLDTGSPEGIADAAHDHGGVVRMFSGEASVLEELMGRHSGSTQPEILNAGFDQDEYSDARRGRKAIGSDVVQHTAALNVNLGLAITGSTVDRLLGDRIAQDRGFVSRCMFIAPETMVGKRQTRDLPSIPSPIKSAYKEAVYRILNHGWGGDGEPLEIALAPDASEMLATLRETIEREARGDLADLGAWRERIIARTLRIALALHAWRWGYGDEPEIPATIEADTFRAALAWVEYQIGHYRRALGLAGGGGSDERRIARKLVERMIHDQTHRLSARDVHELIRGDTRSLHREGSASTEVEARDLILESARVRGWLREEAPPPRPGPGRKPASDWVLNPALLGN